VGRSCCSVWSDCRWSSVDLDSGGRRPSLILLGFGCLAAWSVAGYALWWLVLCRLFLAVVFSWFACPRWRWLRRIVRVATHTSRAPSASASPMSLRSTLDLRASAALGQTALGAGWRLPALPPQPPRSARSCRAARVARASRWIDALRALPALRAELTRFARCATTALRAWVPALRALARPAGFARAARALPCSGRSCRAVGGFAFPCSRAGACPRARGFALRARVARASAVMPCSARLFLFGAQSGLGRGVNRLVAVCLYVACVVGSLPSSGVSGGVLLGLLRRLLL
jgi:hypothetical protein